MKRVTIGSTEVDLYQVSSPDAETGRNGWYVWNVISARVIREFDTEQEAVSFAQNIGHNAA